MQVFPLTIGLLLIMALLTYGNLNTALDQIAESQAALQALKLERAAYNAWEQGVYLIQKGKPISEPQKRPKKDNNHPKKKAPPKRIKATVYPTRLNFSAAFGRGDRRDNYRTVVEQLLIRLYADYPSFSAVPHAEIEITNRLQEQLKEKKDPLSEYLATLDMGDLQPLWQVLLLGDDCPPLLDYFCYKPSDKGVTINITWAPRPLLEALFNQKAKINALLKLQKQIAKEELNEEDGAIPTMDEYKSTAKVEESPFSNLLICTRPTKDHSIPNR